MSRQKNILITVGMIAASSFIITSIAVLLVSHNYSQFQFYQLNAIFKEALKKEPEAIHLISAALKEYTSSNADEEIEKDVLSALGYQSSDFSILNDDHHIFWILIVFLVGIFLFLVTILYRNKMEANRIKALADYLEQVHTGKARILSTTGEDEFSKLEDEIYKTVTFLYQIKDEAVEVKNGFAENLSNIAHQLKTPITAISLSVQMLGKDFEKNHLKQIGKQLKRLTHLEEALLVLSRLDAGTLLLQRQETDIFTVLVLAADNLQELCIEYGTFIEIPELGEMAVSVDLEWTMQAIMNLLQNCIEHNKGGITHCTYRQNSLYKEILIWDEGNGFANEDIPYLFERFYRGQNAGEGGIGIGLALSKEMIERQNGTIRAKNTVEGGACFEVRFYSH